jgi:hypothetical protein
VRQLHVELSYRVEEVEGREQTGGLSWVVADLIGEKPMTV